MLEKILLCGNGINIEFNNDFKLQNFIEILKNENKLQKLINYVFQNASYEKKWKDFLPDFNKIFKKAKKSIENLSNEAEKNGVEVAILTFLESVDTSIRILGIQKHIEKYDKFEQFFKLLFFSYLFKIATNQYSLMMNCSFINGFKNILENYMAIYTLNYDTSLEKFVTDKEFLFYLHGKMFLDNNGINYENCLLESYRNPKEKQPLPLIASVIDRNNLKEKIELDIIGINPINDENIFCLLINSQICKKINFYYHSENDLKNLDIVLEKIKKWRITDIIKNNEKIGLKFINSWDILEYKLDKSQKKYIVIVYSDDGKSPFGKSPSSISLEINLFLSSKFWEKCGKNKILINSTLNAEININ